MAFLVSISLNRLRFHGPVDGSLAGIGSMEMDRIRP